MGLGTGGGLLLPGWQVFRAPFPGEGVEAGGLYLLSDPLTEEGQINTAPHDILTRSHEGH